MDPKCKPEVRCAVCIQLDCFASNKAVTCITFKGCDREKRKHVHNRTNNLRSVLGGLTSKSVGDDAQGTRVVIVKKFVPSPPSSSSSSSTSSSSSSASSQGPIAAGSLAPLEEGDVTTAENDVASQQVRHFLWFDHTPFPCAKNGNEHGGGIFTQVFGAAKGPKAWEELLGKYDAKLKELFEDVVQGPTILVGTGVAGIDHAKDLLRQFAEDLQSPLNELLIDPFCDSDGTAKDFKHPQYVTEQVAGGVLLVHVQP